MSNLKPNFAIIAVALCLSFSEAEAITITFNGNSASSGAPNTLIVPPAVSGGIGLTVSAESLINGGGAWQSSYLGIYSGGLGVTNSSEGNGGNGTHTVDNLGSNDRVVFLFTQAVILDKVWVTQFGDTDLSVYYYSGNTWNFLETNAGGSVNRTANINASSTSAVKWAVGAARAQGSISLPDAIGDSFKLRKIEFTPGPPNRIPDSGSGLLLLGVAVGVLAVVKRQIAIC